MNFLIRVEAWKSLFLVFLQHEQFYRLQCSKKATRYAG